MTSTRFQPITLPRDLANLLIEDHIAAPSQTDMSAPPGMLETIMSVSATVITLIQGPITAAQAVSYLKKWKSFRQKGGDAIGDLRVRHPSGNFDAVITADSDLAQAGQALADLLNAMRPPHMEPKAIAFDDLDD